jgi:ferritin-like metal-binding protein YciE
MVDPRAGSAEGFDPMGLFSTPIKTLDDLFVHTLQDIYYVEKQILKNLPTMAEKVTDPQLKQAFQTHVKETQTHVTRVEEVFRLHGHEAKGVNCPVIDGLVEEAEEIMSDADDPEVLDAALLSAAQAVEHYEITRYGTLAAWAKQLGRQDCASILHSILDEEKRTDAKLSQLAESKVNRKAA